MADPKIEPVGLPAPLKAWKARKPDPLVTMHCGQAGCGHEVGAVYASPKGPVVESRMHPQQSADDPTPVAPEEIAAFGAGLGFTGMVDEFTMPSGTRGSWLTEAVRAQIDLLRGGIYWHDPVPTCPHHGELEVERARLDEAVHAEDQTRYEALPVSQQEPPE